MNTYYKILNEIASVFDMDQWDDQVNLFTDAIDKQLNTFVHNTKYSSIIILINCFDSEIFPQYKFYKERCYVNGEKVQIIAGCAKNKWRDQETVNVTIEGLDQLGNSCDSMFYWCRSLVSVPWFDTSRVTNMKYMFEWCESLVSVPELDISKVNNMESMFEGCESLSKETKKAWESVYNFETHRMKRTK